MRKVAEPGDMGVELHLDGAGRAVTLLTDDQVGFAEDGLHLDLPFRMLVGVRARLFVGQ